ncbi:hypothetical protein LUZ60_001289 [Juncus effusus]|nr:hypothetical protein LUZ60_001289 [Juncus effusus]
MAYTKEQLLSRLQELQIEFECYDHPAVLTVDAQAKYVGHLGGALSKNLFLKDKKHRLYVVSALADTKVDLKILSQRLGLGKGGLRMAPEEALQEVLHVPLGCVTPFALINESASVVSLLLDKGFKSKQTCYFHPLTNEVTIALNSSNLDKFLVSIGREPAYVDLEDCPAVGKDNPPDLANLVPAESVEINALNTVPVQAQTAVPKEKKVQQDKTSERPKVKKEVKKDVKQEVKNDTTNVEKFVENFLDKFSTAFLSEISKNSSADQTESGSSVVQGVKGKLSSDLISMTMMLKNAAYTEGFHAGIESTIYPLKGLLSKK